MDGGTSRSCRGKFIGMTSGSGRLRVQVCNRTTGLRPRCNCCGLVSFDFETARHAFLYRLKVLKDMHGIDFGYDLLRGAWRKGYATESARRSSGVTQAFMDVCVSLASTITRTRLPRAPFSKSGVALETSIRLVDCDLALIFMRCGSGCSYGLLPREEGLMSRDIGFPRSSQLQDHQT
jgi:hypothetical protein